jgi:hypothetical protein
MHQFSLNAKVERITDQPAAASIPHDKKNCITDESVLATLLARSRGSGACADAPNTYANGRARGDRRAARGILIRVPDVAELAMTVAADTIQTAFFGGVFLGSAS